VAFRCGKNVARIGLQRRDIGGGWCDRGVGHIVTLAPPLIEAIAKIAESLSEDPTHTFHSDSMGCFPASDSQSLESQQSVHGTDARIPVQDDCAFHVGGVPLCVLEKAPSLGDEVLRASGVGLDTLEFGACHAT
jgi:hypothetical protein